jgi:hypothetical protein
MISGHTSAAAPEINAEMDRSKAAGIIGVVG